MMQNATGTLLPPRALTFDVVGTLIDFESGILACVRSAAGPDRDDLDDESVLAAFGAAEDRQQRRTPEVPFTAMLDPIGTELAGVLGVPGLDGGGGPGPLRRSIGTWPAFPDAPAALAALHRTFRLMAVTNADTVALAAMARTLGDPFDDLVTVDDTHVNKPDPQVFAFAMGRLSAVGIGRDDVLHVAQSQYHDIGAAHRFGLRTCWVERRRGRPGFGATPAPAEVVRPDLHVGSLDEVARALLPT